MGLLVKETFVRFVKQSVEKAFHRNGQLREIVPLRNGRRHGVVRVWHKNGVLANEERLSKWFAARRLPPVE